MHRLARRGARVVLVTATAGELGPVLRPLRRNETLPGRRRAELERSAAVLGVARLVLLGHRDSGMAGWDDNAHPYALAAAPVDRVAGRLAALCEQEGAEALVHYDPRGIYGHPDHVAVHRIGAAAAARAGIPGYEATVAADRPRTRRPHLVDRACRRRRRLGQWRHHHGRHRRRRRPAGQAAGDGRARHAGPAGCRPPGRLRRRVRAGMVPPHRRARAARQRALKELPRVLSRRWGTGRPTDARRQHRWDSWTLASRP